MDKGLNILGFKGEIDTTGDVLKFHSTDSSAFQVMPSAVLYPKDKQDVEIAVRFARENNKTISVRAGGTCMTGGSLTEGLIINMTRHMTAISIDPIAQTATVEMGAMFRDIEAAAAAHGLMFAPYTSSKAICGIGGMIGNNCSGEKSIRFGAAIDNVISLEKVLAVEEDANLKEKLIALKNMYGEELKAAQGNVREVASGYRLDRITEQSIDPLFIGAQGTLGIVTTATLKLVPIPSYTRLVLIPIDTLHELPYILNNVMNHNPEGVETFDIHTYHRAEKTLPAECALLSPFFAGSTSLLVLAQFAEGTQEESDARAKDCYSTLGAHAARAQYIEDIALADAAWKIRRAAYCVLRDGNAGSLRAVPCIEDVIVPIDAFDLFIPRLTDILERHRIFYGYHGHIGDGSLRVIPIIDTSLPEASDLIISLCREVFDLVKSLGGNMSTDHSDGIIRSPFLKEFYGERLYTMFVEIKSLLDPQGIFNPGKKTGGTEDDIKKYLRR